MSVHYQFYLLAQSAGDAAQETAEQTKDIVSKITTGKVAQALFILLAAYFTLRLLDKLVIWLSEKIAKEWRLRVKQFLPFLRMVVLSFTAITLMNLFFNLSKENILAITGTVAVALGFAFKDYASSIIAGIVGLFESPYEAQKFRHSAMLENDYENNASFEHKSVCNAPKP